MHFFALRERSGPAEPASGWTVLLAVGAAVWSGCDVDRTRPSGPELVLPQTRVELVFPQREQTVPADSIVEAIVRADGLLTSVDVVLRHSVRRDTLAVEREQLSEPQERVEIAVPVRIPQFETGTILEFIAGAENVIGERRSSEVVPVIVIDCRELRLVCGR